MNQSVENGAVSMFQETHNMNGNKMVKYIKILYLSDLMLILYFFELLRKRSLSFLPSAFPFLISVKMVVEVVV